MRRIRIAFVAMLVIFACLMCIGCEDNNDIEGTTDYLSPIDNTIAMVKELDPQLIRGVLAPPEIDYYIDHYKNEKNSDYFNELMTSLNAFVGAYETCGSDWVITYEIEAAKEMDKEALENYKSYDRYYFETFGMDTDDVTAGYRLDLAVSVAGSEGEKTATCSLFTYKYKGEWYSFNATDILTRVMPKG